MMRLFLKTEVEQSIKDFDEGLDDYFANSLRYRSSLRRGSIVLLDNNKDLFNFFTFLAEKCGMRAGVVHVEHSQDAKKAIQDMGIEKVKAVVIDVAMVGESLNGDSLTNWLRVNHPNVPVWIVNCEQKKRDWIYSQTRQIGVLGKNIPLPEVADALGFPKECREYAKEYAI